MISSAEEQFSQNVNTEVLAPLGLQKLEDNTELVTMVNNLKEATNSENTNAENLDSFVAENTALVGFAKKYVMLESEKDEKVSLLANEQAGESLAASYSGQIGRVIEPVIKPLGFDWKIGVGLVSGMAAKEVLVSTLGTIYSVGEADEESTPLAEAIKNDPANKKKYMFHTNLEKELLFYFNKISEEDKKEIIEFTKIKARKPL